MNHPANNFWKRVPFLKLLLPLIAGISIQHYFSVPKQLLVTLPVTGITIICAFNLFSLTAKFIYWYAFTFAAWLVFFSLGAWLVYEQTVQTRLLQDNIPTKPYQWIATINEPPVRKPKTLKAEVRVLWIFTHDSIKKVDRKIIAYFQPKDSASLIYGTHFLSNNSLQQITSTGNPGAFDYQQYCRLQGITHQVFLQPAGYQILPIAPHKGLRKFIFDSRARIVAVIRNYIHGKKETGLAEALLIGYKDDLDKTLVQSYANTGVVHIIAISGLHLGMIYWLLVVLLKPLRSVKRIAWISPFFIITGLWIFTLMAGAQPSILRSAVMFTCIVIGESLSRKSSVFNTMAVSAFILLCMNPYWLWDAGFQLSYAAVLSILIFMKPVYNLLQPKNKLLDACWKLNAVTISAQILTIPFCIYHFNQFPNLFILTNFIAVPLSSLVLFGEIFLCGIAFIPAVAKLTGTILTWLIACMNTFIEHVERIPFSAWTGLSINSFQALTLMIIIASLASWLWYRSMGALKLTIICVTAFCIVRSTNFIRRAQQKLIIVYNISGKSAIDLISGRHYTFLGDPAILSDQNLLRFHILPARIIHRVTAGKNQTGTFNENKYLSFGNKRILLLNEKIVYNHTTKNVRIDLLIISGKPLISLEALSGTMLIGSVVLDGSVSMAIAKRVRASCALLKIPVHDVKLNGAFVMKGR